MSQPENVLTGLLALNDANLTTSQRNRCLTLYALQDDSFGMFSQWLYSRSLERENIQNRTIIEQEEKIKKIKTFETFLIEENNRIKKLLEQKQEEMSNLEQTLVDELSLFKSQLRPNNNDDKDLLEIIESLEALNEMLLQSLYQAMLEIQRFIGLSN